MNPELLRNLWLEFSVRRLIAMPLVLAVIFAAPLLHEQPKHASPERQITLFDSPFPDAGTSLVVSDGFRLPFIAPDGVFALTGILLAATVAILLFLWGARLAADSLFSEVTGRTWDGQRSSAIGAWQMTVGKLFGSTAFVWYGAAFCVAVAAYLQAYSVAMVMTVLVAGLWAQALALFTALLLLRMAPDRTRFRVTLAQAVILPVGLLLISLLQSGMKGDAHWYGIAIPQPWFVPMSVALAAGWTVIGIHQLMRAELQLTAQPATWIGFLAALGLYFGGLAYRAGAVVAIGAPSERAGAIAGSLLAASIVILLAGPASALLSPPRLLPLRRFLSVRGPGRAGLADAPYWLWPIVLAALLTAVAAMLSPIGAGTLIFGDPIGSLAVPAAVTLLLFALRDIGILHMMSLNPNARRGTMATIVIMVLCYIAGPLVMKAAHASDLSLLFRPDFLAPAAAGILVAATEAAVTWALALRTYRHFARLLPLALLAVLFQAPTATARWADDPCPRTTAHEALLEAGIIFEGKLLSRGPPAECAHLERLCAQEVFTFQADRILKGRGEPGATITANRISTSGPIADAGDPRLEVPQSGFYVLTGTGGYGARGLRSSYATHECLLGLPQDLRAAAEAYADRRDALKAAADAAAGDPGPAVALAGYMLVFRDAAARDVLERAVVTFPASQALRAQYLHQVDPNGVLGIAGGWSQISGGLSTAVRVAIEAEAKPDPASPWVRRFAIALRRRPAEPDSPLHTTNDFSAYSFNQLKFAGASLHGANFADAEIQNSDFRGSDLSDADLRWAEFDNVDLSYARLTNARLDDWNPATQQNGILRHRYRPRYDGPGMARFFPYGASGMILLRATLDGARMERATLVGADLRQASLKNTVLRDADLRQADLRGADLTGADLTGAVLDEARFDCATIWPKGFAPAAKPDPASTTALCRESMVVRQ